MTDSSKVGASGFFAHNVKTTDSSVVIKVM